MMWQHMLSIVRSLEPHQDLRLLIREIAGIFSNTDQIRGGYAKSYSTEIEKRVEDTNKDSFLDNNGTRLMDLYYCKNKLSLVLFLTAGT
ncbi:hypothetical protein [Salinibacillus kushneri]|uniref:hypothetical protein n=1 Tax=Salinibacillus kushneri TaxID=237682 RepID=UPI0015A68F57|nr:hypothetical protein [Salinibacillus kushneri]